MSRDDQAIEFTVGDRTLLERIDTKLGVLCNFMDCGKRCQKHEDDLEVLKTSRKRWSRAFVSVGSGGVLAALVAAIKHFIGQ